MYLIRLDDASEYWDKEKWHRISAILDKYEIKPIFGIIPDNKDKQLLKYDKDENFWNTVKCWIDKGYTPALHSYNHVYNTENAGINPVNKKSEFAGLPIEEQLDKIKQGNEILISHGIQTEIFFALAHTFDKNTLKALESETEIRVISDTVANNVYYKDNFYFIPQQAGSVRKLPFKVVTFCYHPNTMTEQAFIDLEKFLFKYKNKFVAYSNIKLKKRKFGFYDYVVNRAYFSLRKIRKG